MAAEQALDTDTPPAPPRRSKKVLLLVIFGTLTLVSVAAAAALYFAKNTELAASAVATADGNDAEPAKPLQKPPIYVSLEPPFVVNFEEQGQLRFLQADIVVTVHEEAAMQAIKDHNPRIRNNIIMLLGNQRYETLSSKEGKENLRTAVLTEIRRVVKEVSGADGADAVYFTSFVMQ